MDFGRLQNRNELERLDLRLPPDDPGTGAVLAGLSSNRVGATALSKPRVYVACPVWNHAGLARLIYPPGAKPPDYLRYYARSFNSIELNTTFYGVKPDLLRRWREMVPPHFRFVPKINREISHAPDLRSCESELSRFCHAVAELGETLGPLLLLLPGHFGPERLDDLAEFARRFPRDLELAVELRHPGWFAGANRPLFELLEEHGVAAVITDVAGRRDVLHQRLTSRAGTAVIRYAGNDLHPTDFSRIDDWVERLADWFGRGLRTLYFCLHQTRKELTVELAIYLIHRLNERCGLQLQPPQLVAGQQELF
jgi:uncharacterized protein YecE (DUF72 family)